MAQQDLIQQAVAFFVQNPQMLTSLLEHPYSAVREATGQEEVSRDEVSQVITATSALAEGQAVDFGSIANIAAGLLSQNGGSAHSLASALLGGSAVSAQNGVSTDVISNLAGVMFGGGQANNKDSIDLSDGFGLDDLAVLAKKFL